MFPSSLQSSIYSPSRPAPVSASEARLKAIAQASADIAQNQGQTKAELKIELEKEVDKTVKAEFDIKKAKINKEIRDLEAEKEKAKELFTEDVKNKRRKLRTEEEGKELKILEGRRDALKKEVHSWKTPKGKEEGRSISQTSSIQIPSGTPSDSEASSFDEYPLIGY